MNIEEQAIRYLFQSEPETVFCVPAIIKTLGLRGKAAKRLNGLLREMVRSGELLPRGARNRVVDRNGADDAQWRGDCHR